MTAAQNKARARFKAAIKQAAKLRKANPKLSQAEAVKKAYADLYGKSKTTKKIGDFNRAGTKVKDETGPKKYKKPDYKTTRKKDGTFSKWKKIGATKETRHTDNKSHNVNIRVMSGASDIIADAQKRKSEIIKRVSKLNQDISYLIDHMHTFTPIQKGRARSFISIYKKSITKYKKEIKNLDSIISDNLSK